VLLECVGLTSSILYTFVAKVYELMQDEGIVMVELDMLFKLDTYLTTHVIIKCFCNYIF